MRISGRSRMARSGFSLVALGICAACSTITGASEYTDIAGCTGPACSLQCTAQGGRWEAAARDCTCASGSPLCSGICCGTTAPYCVTTSAGVERCSACTEVAYECGSVCCEHQSCLNAEIGACGAAYGEPSQSCAGGLICPIPQLDGTTEQANCCASQALPGGAFEMGRSIHGKNRCPASLPADLPCTDNELPAHQVTLSPFQLDRFEVTVGRIRKFVDAWDYQGLPVGAGGDGVVAGAGWQSAWNANLPSSKAEFENDLAGLNDHFDIVTITTWTATPGYYENLPINCVSWYEAFAFCAWDGGRLPTEAEWEYAAGNGRAGDLYPWGESVPTPSMSVYDCTSDPDPCLITPPFPAFVGSRAKDQNRWGNRDLGGNIAEWTLDAVGPYLAASVTNYANVADGFRVVRGGDFDDGAYFLRAAFRGSENPTETTAGTGFRCARAP
jgi:sulfatase modifying factor 1